jgi:hypothetical protein
MIVRGSWAGGSHKALYEYYDQINKVKVYYWKSAGTGPGAGTFLPLTDSKGDTIINVHTPQVGPGKGFNPNEQEYNK